jgi:hypothetical protein
MSIKYNINQVKTFNNLENSLIEAGQIEPIITFIDTKNIEHIVDGEKRSIILKKMNKEVQKKAFNGLIKLFGFILDSKEIYESSIWKYFHIFKNNNFTEKDIYTSVIKDRLKLSIRDIWKLLEIEYSFGTEELLTELDISLKELISYYEFEKKDFNSLLILFKTLKANKNNRKDLFIIINEVIKRDDISFSNLMEKPEVIEIIESELQASEKINVFKKYIYTLRYPNISKEVEILTNLKNKIKTPGFKLDFPIDKESNKSI